jgi:hypothetical protein
MDPLPSLDPTQEHSTSAGRPAVPVWQDTVRALLLETWGAQACRRPADWPDVLGRLLKSGVGLSGGMTRTSMKDAVDDAVIALAAAFDANAPLPDDPSRVVWRAFTKLDHVHCRLLAQRLVEARQHVAVSLS